MRTINHESDFKLIEGFKDGSSILAAPFRFTYYTKVSRGVYVAEYNGSEYVNCIPTEDGKVIVPFDSPKLGMGVLMVKREFFLNDSDYKDGICNLVSVESTGITLDKGATDDLGEIEVLIEPYYHTINGGGDIENGSITEIKLADNAVSTKKIKDGAVTEDKLSEEVKEKLNQQSGGYEPPVGGIPKADLSEEVQASLRKADTALQEHQDLSNYATLSKVQEVAADLVTKDSHALDIEGLQNTINEVESSMITAEPAEGDSEGVDDYVLMKSDIEHIIPHVVDHTDSVATIQPNVLNVWGEVASLDITLAEPTDNTIVNEYMAQFVSGATATTLTLPNTIKWMAAPNIQPNKTYQLSIINNLGVIGEFSHE